MENNELQQDKSKYEKFKEAALPLIKYLAENHNPHTTIIVTSTNAELLSGEMTTGDITEFIKD